MNILDKDVLISAGSLVRVVKLDADVAWCIEINNPLAWPLKTPLNHLIGLERYVAPPATKHTVLNAKRIKKRDEALERLGPLLERLDDLLIPSNRNYYLNERADQIGCSVRTLHKDLRRYWQGGKTKNAVLPTYQKSGRARAADGSESAAYTAGRGRKSEVHPIFQMSSEDEKKCRDIIECEYLQKERKRTLTDAHVLLLWKHYSYESEGKKHLNPEGEYPTYRQLRHFLHKNWNIETIKRARKGEANYLLEDRAVTGTILEDCLGIGHYYEIDATIVDVYLVAKDDVRVIIGKPTLYTIRDRYSRLFVGFYFGLENASWNGALQAILSIAEDKEKLCQRYGVEYRPDDWPAHQKFPAQFLADRGETFTHASTSIADELHCIVTNTPGRRADWKAVVECGFKEIQESLRSVAPAYDPPSNATKRQGEHYEKDACLNMKEFGNLLLNSLLKLNREEIRGFKRTAQEILAQVATDPISLWNYDETRRAGMLSRYTEEHVRLSLLRRDTATVTEKGIVFNNLHYDFPEAEKLKWYVMARHRRFDVEVAFDTRLCDSVYVFSRDKSAVYLAHLKSSCNSFSGYSYEEAAYVHKMDKRYKLAGQHAGLSAAVEFVDATAATVDSARKKLKEAKPGTRTARRADIKPARHAERAHERSEKAALPELPKTAQIINLPVPTNPVADTPLAPRPSRPNGGGAFASALASIRNKNRPTEI